MTPHVRASSDADWSEIETLYPAAFPEEDLLPVVRALWARDDVLSLVAVDGDRVVGHVAFTTCTVGDEGAPVALLAPLCAAPDRRKRGIGSALVREGLARVAADGARCAYVLGDPAYYRRFGFETEARAKPPYPLPAEWRDAWRSIRLDADAPMLTGPLVVPEPWRDPALWGPE